MTTPMTPGGFAREIGVSRETLSRFERYAALLAEWNRAINLVSQASLADLWRRHMLDSAQLLDHLPPAPEGRPRVIADLGSGAGFPGLVLALLGAGAVHLIEADRRKAAFLREAARILGLAVEIHDCRIEAMAPLSADVITARACARLPRLLAHSAALSDPERAGPQLCLFLKGKRVDQELTEAHREWNIAAERFPSRSDSSGTILRIGLFGRDATKC